MKCPVCKSELVKGKDEKFETCSEHACDPNKTDYPLRSTWLCGNKECELDKYDYFWSESGELYSSDIPWGTKSKINWIGDNDAPFGTISRRLNVEVYKKGLKKKIYLHPAFCLWFLQPMIEFEYTSNDDGEVLSKKIKINYLKKDKDRGEYCTYWSSSFSTLKLYFKSFRRTRIAWKKHKTSFMRRELKDDFKIQQYNTRWEYKFYHWYVNTFCKKLKSSLYYYDLDSIKNGFLKFGNIEHTSSEFKKIITKATNHDNENAKSIIDDLISSNFFIFEKDSYWGKGRINKVELRKYKLGNLI
jgi:hypothetical protein